MKYQKGDLVVWKKEWDCKGSNPKEETIMLIKEIINTKDIDLKPYYRYVYLETQRQDSYLSNLYDEQTDFLKDNNELL
jgi:hypothetical protein